jgi:phytoene synthase
LLPLSCRPGIQAARVLYAAIGHEVGRRGGDSVTQRTVVPGSRKLRLLAGALVSGAWTRRGRGHALPPLDAVRWLVEAAVLHDPTLASTRSAAQPRTDVPPLNAATRVVWVIELCEQQAVRRQGRRGESIAH